VIHTAPSRAPARAVPPGGQITSTAFPDVLAAAQAGGEWAVARLYRSVNPRLERYLRAHVGQEAADVASATWLDVARNLGSFHGDEDGFRGWVFTIGRRRMSDHRRREKRRPATPITSADFDTVTTPGADAAAFNGPLGDAAARSILALLPADQAEVLLLRVVADLEMSEVARITGRSPGNVRVMQHRALRRLAELLQQGAVDVS
jgi:RNA polymerase sigma-70 factor (ECF subfamily)